MPTWKSDFFEVSKYLLWVTEDTSLKTARYGSVLSLIPYLSEIRKGMAEDLALQHLS